METAVRIIDTNTPVTSREADTARWIFDGLKPLRAACTSPEFDFLAYLLEMSETEAHRLMIAKRNQVNNP